MTINRWRGESEGWQPVEFNDIKKTDKLDLDDYLRKHQEWHERIDRQLADLENRIQELLEQIRLRT